MSRKKQAALPVPTSTDAARELMAEYVDAERQIKRAQLVAEQAIDAVKAERDALIALYAVPNAQRFAALKAWWEAGGKDLAGKKRSAELAGATLGIRLTTPAVKFAKPWNGEKVLKWLQGLRWMRRGEFLRTKVELDKQAVIKLIGERDVAKIFATVLTVVQTDEFFIDCTIDETPIAAQAEG